MNRANIDSVGFFELQFFDAEDSDANPYDDAHLYALPINWAARYTSGANADGLDRTIFVANTPGPIGNWLCWLGVGGDTRKFAQWSQIFAAKISATGPLKAKAIRNASIAVDTTLAETAVTCLDGSSPSVGAFGLVVSGTDLHAQYPLFVPIGGGGTTFTWYLITVNNADGTYVGQKVNFPGDTPSGVDVNLVEDNHAPGVPTTPHTYVRATHESDGNWYFPLPLGCG